VPGTYTLTVNGVARASEISSQGFATRSAAITQGTVQIGTVSGASATITIDGTNDTLQGLANAINQAGVGVTAGVVSDGSGSAKDLRQIKLPDWCGGGTGVPPVPPE
jgi:flagellar hook-associated protein 2